jgi:7-cyano-7-deazaguanine synthase
MSLASTDAESKLNSAIVLLSGGIDSATALYWTKQQTTNIFTMNIEYAQASYQEATAARNIAKAAGVKEHITVSLPIFKDIQTRYHPTKPQSSAVTTAYVPARNLIFYGFAVAYAETLNTDAIVFGSNADDAQELPDATPDFIRRMNELVETGTRMGVNGPPAKIIDPLINFSKTDVLRLAINLKVPLELTWSCYEDVELPCGKCRGCRTRLDAFNRLGMTDPLEYA